MHLSTLYLVCQLTARTINAIIMQICFSFIHDNDVDNLNMITFKKTPDLHLEQYILETCVDIAMPGSFSQINR